MDTSVYRRKIMSRFVPALFLGVGGCLSNSESNGTSPTESPTLTRDLHSLLPVAESSWSRERTGDPAIGGLGAVDGVEADYESPEGTFFRVNIVLWDSQEVASHRAGMWKEVGWPVVVAYGRYLFAAGSGTPKKTETLTPEHAPQMPTTPVPNSEDDARELLALSPALTPESIRENEV